MNMYIYIYMCVFVHVLYISFCTAFIQLTSWVEIIEFTKPLFRQFPKKMSLAMEIKSRLGCQEPQLNDNEFEILDDERAPI